MKKNLFALAALLFVFAIFTESAYSQVIPDKPVTQDEKNTDEGNDGEIGKSDIPSSVDELFNAGEIAKIYPNPSSEYVQVNFVLNESAKVQASLYDLSGKKVATIYNKTLAKGQVDFNAVLPKLQNGTYLLVVDAGNQFLRERIAIL